MNRRWAFHVQERVRAFRRWWAETSGEANLPPTITAWRAVAHEYRIVSRWLWGLLALVLLCWVQDHTGVIERVEAQQVAMKMLQEQCQAQLQEQQEQIERVAYDRHRHWWWWRPWQAQHSR